jgi:DNA-binding CsgD family transcriptional regulator
MKTTEQLPLSQEPKRKGRLKRFPDVPNPWGLSGGEWLVLARLVDDVSYQQLADTLFLDINTITAYVWRARKKMKVKQPRYAVILMALHLAQKKTA